MLEKFGGWSTILAELCDGNDLTAEKTELYLVKYFLVNLKHLRLQLF